MTRPASPAVAAGMGDVLRLAWPAVVSVLLNNAYRVNDQYWVQGLGQAAHAAIGASTFVLVMNFGVIVLATGGTLALVARATGSGDRRERDVTIRSALALGLGLALLLSVAGSLLAPHVAGLLGLAGETATATRDYLATLYLFIAPLVLAPILDSAFIAMGNTRMPMALQVLAVSCNAALNPLFIYGAGSFEGMGIAGAALATCISRAISAVIALVLLRRLFGVKLFGDGGARRARVAAIARLGLPLSLSIFFYAGVYWVLLALVLSRLGTEAIAGLGIGFNVFEGVSFPVFLGIALAASSLVGRNLGAGDLAGARLAVRNARRAGRAAGALFALLFLVGRHALAPLFTDDPAVLAETLSYVGILAWSQIFVADEAVHEKALIGAGETRPIFWISTTGNLVRIPLAYVLAITLGLASPGLWWAINATTLLKALLLRRAYERNSAHWGAPVVAGRSSVPRLAAPAPERAPQPTELPWPPSR